MNYTNSHAIFFIYKSGCLSAIFICTIVVFKSRKHFVRAITLPVRAVRETETTDHKRVLRKQQKKNDKDKQKNKDTENVQPNCNDP